MDKLFLSLTILFFFFSCDSKPRRNLKIKVGLSKQNQSNKIPHKNKVKENRSNTDNKIKQNSSEDEKIVSKRVKDILLTLGDTSQDKKFQPKTNLSITKLIKNKTLLKKHIDILKGYAQKNPKSTYDMVTYTPKNKTTFGGAGYVVFDNRTGKDIVKYFGK